MTLTVTLFWLVALTVLYSLVSEAISLKVTDPDAFLPCWELCWWGEHKAMYDKSQAYSVEAVNADLRHYLARLEHRPRCFSRCLNALRHAVDPFVRCYNARQLRKRKYPRYPAPLAATI